MTVKKVYSAVSEVLDDVEVVELVDNLATRVVNKCPEETNDDGFCQLVTTVVLEHLRSKLAIAIYTKQSSIR